MLIPVVGKAYSGYDEVMLAAWPPPVVVPGGRGYISKVSMLGWWFISRFRILIVTIPLSALVTVVRFLLIYTKFTVSLADSTILPPLVAACAFILANVLANVLADYKEVGRGVEGARERNACGGAACARVACARDACARVACACRLRA